MLNDVLVYRSKNFEKTGEYATAWKKDEDGKMGVDGPRVVVGDQSQVPQQGYITRSDIVRFIVVYWLCSVNRLHPCISVDSKVWLV